MPTDVEVVDLSATGCLVRGEHRMDKERVVDLVLDVGVRTVHAKARVVECSRDGEAPSGQGTLFLTGLEFLSMSDQDADALRLCVDSNPDGAAQP